MRSLFVSGVVLCSVGLLLAVQNSTSARRKTERADSVQSSLRVMSYNIRYNNPDDGVNAWPHRKERVASVIRFHRADVAGLQEALEGQIRDLEKRLPGYSWLGVGRQGGEEGGEYNPIFYRTDRFDVLDHDTFWLSKTPDVPGSKSWDSALPRIVTWARFRDRTTGASFFHFNTHFDHRGEQARKESARILAQNMEEIAGAVPAVVTGDFNVEDDSEVYQILTESLRDARLASKQPPHGPEATFFGFEVVDRPGRRIDYVFTKNGVAVRRFGTLTDQLRGRYPSDHLPVLAEVEIE